MTHYKETRIERLGHALYMWRIVNGKYDNILKELNTKDKK